MLKFRTESGSLYILDGNRLSRFNEEIKVLRASDYAPLPDCEFVVIEVEVPPTVGRQAFFLTEPTLTCTGHLSTTRVTEIFDDVDEEDARLIRKFNDTEPELWT